MIIYILLASLLLVSGCRSLQVVELSESDVEEEFNVCFPPRGEEVKFHFRAAGHALNSTQYDCI